MGARCSWDAFTTDSEVILKTASNVILNTGWEVILKTGWEVLLKTGWEVEEPSSDPIGDLSFPALLEVADLRSLGACLMYFHLAERLEM